MSRSQALLHKEAQYGQIGRRRVAVASLLKETPLQTESGDDGHFNTDRSGEDNAFAIKRKLLMKIMRAASV
jgi:hypothetical protein